LLTQAGATSRRRDGPPDALVCPAFNQKPAVTPRSPRSNALVLGTRDPTCPCATFRGLTDTHNPDNFDLSALHFPRDREATMRHFTTGASKRRPIRCVSISAFSIALACCLLPGSARCQEAPGPEENIAIARIHELGGRITRDETKPGHPVRF